MAGVFALATFVVVGALVASSVGWLGTRRRGGRRLNRYLPLVGAFSLLFVYLVAKIAYEEIYPCVFIDAKYCDFASTQYRNLFGWEF
jgi:hypothetical protein